MSHSRKTITLSPIQAEIIYTLAALHNRTEHYDDGNRTLARIIFGHYSHSATITRAVNEIVKKSGEQLITNKLMPYINIKSLNEMGIRTTSASELWQDLINHPDFVIQTNEYVACIRKDKLYGEFTLRPSYLLGDGEPVFSSLPDAKIFTFRQDASKALKQALADTVYHSDELLGKKNSINLCWVSTKREEIDRLPKIFIRVVTPHLLMLQKKQK